MKLLGLTCCGKRRGDNPRAVPGSVFGGDGSSELRGGRDNPSLKREIERLGQLGCGQLLYRQRRRPYSEFKRPLRPSELVERKGYNDTRYPARKPAAEVPAPPW